MERKERVIATCDFVKSPPLNPMGFLKTWRDRFFVLSEVESIGFGSERARSYELKYYACRKDFETGCLCVGSIDFGSIQRVSTCKDVLRTHRFTLCIETESRCYLLCTDTAAHCNQWAALIRELRFGIGQEGSAGQVAIGKTPSFSKTISKLRRVSVTTTNSGGSSSSSSGNPDEGRIEGLGTAINITTATTVESTPEQPNDFSDRSKSELSRRPLPAIPHSQSRPRPWSMIETPSFMSPTTSSEPLTFMTGKRVGRKSTGSCSHRDAAIHEGPATESGYVSMRAAREEIDPSYVKMSDLRYEYEMQSLSHFVEEKKSGECDSQATQESKEVSLAPDRLGNRDISREGETILKCRLDNASEVDQRGKSPIYSSIQKPVMKTKSNRELVTDDEELQRTVSRALTFFPKELTVDGIGKWLDEVLSNSAASFGESHDTRL